MKGIYLLMRGDIASEFILNLDLDFGLQNLHKVMKHQIYYALDLALRKTVVSSNFFFEQLKILFYQSENLSEIQNENYKRFFVHFTIQSGKFDVPINYFFFEENMKKYMECFRYLFTFRKELFELQNIWQLHNSHRNTQNETL